MFDFTLKVRAQPGHSQVYAMQGLSAFKVVGCTVVAQNLTLISSVCSDMNLQLRMMLVSITKTGSRKEKELPVDYWVYQSASRSIRICIVYLGQNPPNYLPQCDPGEIWTGSEVSLYQRWQPAHFHHDDVLE